MASEAIAAGASATYQLNHGDVVELATAPLPDAEHAAATEDVHFHRETARMLNTMCPSPA